MGCGLMIVAILAKPKHLLIHKDRATQVFKRVAVVRFCNICFKTVNTSNFLWVEDGSNNCKFIVCRSHACEYCCPDRSYPHSWQLLIRAKPPRRPGRWERNQMLENRPLPMRASFHQISYIETKLEHNRMQGPYHHVFCFFQLFPQRFCPRTTRQRLGQLLRIMLYFVPPPTWHHHFGLGPVRSLWITWASR